MSGAIEPAPLEELFRAESFLQVDLHQSCKSKSPAELTAPAAQIKAAPALVLANMTAIS
jgi:hypothetical protein